MHTMTTNQKEELNNKIVKFLNSNYALLLLAVVISFFWAIKFPYISLLVLTAFEICVFIFCKDNPKAFIFPIIAFSYVLNSFFNGIDLTHILAGVFILVFIICVVVYVIRQVYVYKKQVHRGKMFLPFILLGVGNIFGGLIGHFYILSFLAVALLSFIVYAIYWFCINFLSDYKKYFAYCLLFLSLTISLELIFAYIQLENLSNIFGSKLVRVGIGEINTAAIFMLTGVCSCFYLASNNKKDYLFVLLALLIDIFIFLTYSRITILIAGIISIVYFFFIFKKSQNKKIFTPIIISIVGIVGICIIVFFDKIYSICYYYINMGVGSNGRQSLWPWCLTKFLENPIFGIGYYTKDSIASSISIPGLNYIGDFLLLNAHNVFLQIITSTGIFGLICCLPFYIKKYSMTFKNFNPTKLFVLMTFICGFLSSCFDPTPVLNPFYVVLNLILIAIVENDNYGIENNLSMQIQSNEKENDLKSKNRIKNKKVIKVDYNEKDVTLNNENNNIKINEENKKIKRNEEDSR